MGLDITLTGVLGRPRLKFGDLADKALAEFMYVMSVCFSFVFLSSCSCGAVVIFFFGFFFSKNHPRASIEDMRHALFVVGEEPVISTSTMYRFATKNANEAAGGKRYSYTRISLRGLPANTDGNKLIRKEAARMLLNFEDRGWLPMYVDETHWALEPSHMAGWSGLGEKTLFEVPSNCPTISCVCAISEFGVEYAEVETGMAVGGDYFKAYMLRLMKNLKEKKRENCVFYMDNSSVHNSVCINYFSLYIIYFRQRN
jgi:hypothetical protein